MLFRSVYVIKGSFKKGICNQLAKRQFEYVKEKSINTVILVARWSLYTEGNGNGYVLSFNDDIELTLSSSRKAFEHGLEKTVEAYSELGVRIVILLQVPEQEVIPSQLYTKLFSSSEKGNFEKEEFIKNTRLLWKIIFP